MCNKNCLVDETLELLREVRVEVQGDVGDGVVRQLDEAIRKLDDVSRTRHDRTVNQEALELLGKVIEWLPAMIKLIEILRD